LSARVTVLRVTASQIEIASAPSGSGTRTVVDEVTPERSLSATFLSSGETSAGDSASATSGKSNSTCASVFDPFCALATKRPFQRGCAVGLA